MGTIYRNGKVNTIIKNGKIYGYASGGGGTNILSGITDPTSSQGNNGQIYLKYTELENAYDFLDYIESNGNQSIDTDVIINSTSYFEFKGAFTQNSNNNNIFGIGYPNKECTTLVGSGDKIYLQLGANNTYISYDTNDHIFKANANEILIDSTTGNPNWNNIPIGQNIRLFATSYGGTFDSNRISYAKIYYCKIYNDTTLIRHFVPVKRKSDDELGMLDLVNNVFYDNDGTGSFTAGQTITPSSIIMSPILNTYLKVNNTWQSLIGSDINDVGNTSETATPINMSNITRFQEGSMSSASAENVTSVIWNNGQLIGSTIYYTNSINVTNINKLYYELQTGTCYGGSHQSRNDWKLMIALRSTAPNSILQGNYSSLGFSAGSEFNDASTNYGTQEIDVSELTGNYYLVVNSHGWNVNLSNLRYE